jgi:uncharacterized protein
MIEAGKYYKLKIVKKVDFGLYLDAEGEEILLPKRFVPAQAKEGDEVEVFIYHDNEGRPIATTQKANAAVGEIALMKVVGKTEHGAFLDWGLMKDLFLPLSQQVSRIHEGISYLVYIYIDEQTGRVAATERIDKYLKNDELTVQVNEPVDLMVWQKTDIGYKMIINNKHTGVLHFSDVFRELEYGEKLKGFIKTIREENKIDVAIGEKGYARVVPETDKIIQLLKDNNGYLPYSDKSSPEEIYSVFGISKKTFKMALGALYKERKVELTKTGIKIIG